MLFNSHADPCSRVIGVVMLMGLVHAKRHLAGRLRHPPRAQTPRTARCGRGPSRADALLMAAKVRLRPILMTTLAMVLGMVPLAFALTEGSEQARAHGPGRHRRRACASSLLTLVVVPSSYCYMDDLAQWARRRWQGRSSATTA